MPQELDMYECLSKFREPLISEIIDSLQIPVQSKGLDAGCGIGSISKMLAETVGEKGDIIGLDKSEDFIRYARDHNKKHNIKFIEGDINTLEFDDNAFDWIWSIDTVWPGPKELGFPAEDPREIIKGFYRVLKQGGSLFLLFWSAQKLLPGYPVLEARLNTTRSATAPWTKETKPLFHIMNGKYWLKNAGFSDISVKTYVGDITAPLNENDRNALRYLLDMFWAHSEAEVTKNDWDEFTRISDPDAHDSILKHEYYYGFYTYTLFRGRK
jgi:ubiquinone/menaquinone biosynthesis C-methylase UbiE